MQNYVFRLTILLINVTFPYYSMNKLFVKESTNKFLHDRSYFSIVNLIFEYITNILSDIPFLNHLIRMKKS